MVECAEIYDAFQAAGVSFFTGVPDSLLRAFSAFVGDSNGPREHLIAGNEGGAVALAAGHYLATGRPGVVYMQNSGQGNAVNPLLSLADPEVYGIPMVLVVGWRGRPGEPDEPQHRKQGRVMLSLFDAMEIPWHILSDSCIEAKGQIISAVDEAQGRCGPTALIVKKNLFVDYMPRYPSRNRYLLSREEALKEIVDKLPSSCSVVATTGKMSRELWEYRARRGGSAGHDFLVVGSMGHASQIALGIAMAQPQRRIVCLDGDGALFMHMGALATIGQQRPANFLHIVMNNGAHDSVGGQPTPGFDVDIPAIAAACGYRQSCSTDSQTGIADAMPRLLVGEGPSLMEIRLKRGARSDLGRPTSTPADIKRRFMDLLALAKTAEKAASR